MSLNIHDMEKNVWTEINFYVLCYQVLFYGFIGLIHFIFDMPISYNYIIQLILVFNCDCTYYIVRDICTQLTEILTSFTNAV